VINGFRDLNIEGSRPLPPADPVTIDSLFLPPPKPENNTRIRSSSVPPQARPLLHTATATTQVSAMTPPTVSPSPTRQRSISQKAPYRDPSQLPVIKHPSPPHLRRVVLVSRESVQPPPVPPQVAKRTLSPFKGEKPENHSREVFTVPLKNRPKNV